MGARRFITFEGGEGSGKSTQARRLADRLAAAGLEAVLTREPGGTPFAEAIREALLQPWDRSPNHLAQALAFNAARSDHLDAVIRPALASGRFVVCDRFADSTIAYQCYAGDLPLDIATGLNRLIVGETLPALTFILDLEPQLGLRRAADRRTAAATSAAAGRQTGTELDMFEARELSFHEKLRAGFLTIARQNPERCIVCDATREPDAIEEEVWRVTCKRFDLTDR